WGRAPWSARSDLAVTGLGVLRPFGLRPAFGDPWVLVLVDGDVGVHQARFEGLRVQLDGVGLDLDSPVDVLPFPAVHRELPGERRRQRDVVPALPRERAR